MRDLKRSDSKTSGKCLVCHNDLGFLRKLVQHRFCCLDHERMYEAELEEAAVMRLRTLEAAARIRCSVRV